MLKLNKILIKKDNGEKYMIKVAVCGALGKMGQELPDLFGFYLSFHQELSS